VSVDDLGVTEPAAVGESATAVTQPSPAGFSAVGEFATAVTQQIPVVAEPCSQCGAPLALDQRYCLQCGAPRVHVNGPISGGRPGGPRPQAPSPAGGDAGSQATPASPQTPPGAPAGPPGTPPGLGSARPVNRNNTLALLAGVGVLLLAMGVGVLIGRAGVGSAKAPPAQVISVGGSVVGGSAAGASTATTPTTATSETPAAGSAKKAAKGKAAPSSSSGASISKPAPPTVLKSVSKGQSGSSYEQKSKNLPDVVETG
jgi:hypothetical protein